MLVALWGISASAEDPDYHAERIALAESPEYAPYSLQLLQYTLLREHHELASDPETTISEINAPLQRLHDLYPLSIQANFQVAVFLEYVASLTEPAEDKAQLLEMAAAKRTKAEKILKSITLGKDGKSFSTAFQVINIMEEHAVLNSMGLQPTGQALIESEGQIFDEFTATDKNGSEVSILFDISSFYGKDEK